MPPFLHAALPCHVTLHSTKQAEFGVKGISFGDVCRPSSIAGQHVMSTCLLERDILAAAAAAATATAHAGAATGGCCCPAVAAAAGLLDLVAVAADGAAAAGGWPVPWGHLRCCGRSAQPAGPSAVCRRLPAFLHHT